ncbi:CPBP family intramembrane metalloprotease [Candidatus Bathyarchaeota archaeon]|nr:CPBP family intramembrane metalloprotease [Candidatus Bathyarchaeota archaeon]
MEQPRNSLFKIIHPAIASLTILLFVIEYYLAYVSEALGLLTALVSTLIIYGIISILNVSEALAKALEDISLLLIYIMLVAGLPWFYLSQTLFTPAVYSLVIALCLWRLSARHPQMTLMKLAKHIGIKRENLGRNCLIGLAGIPMGAIEYLILKPQPPTPYFDPTYFLQTAAYMLFFVALGEELLFRAMIQRSLTDFMEPKAGIFWAALIFAAMHTIWRSIPELFFVFGAGILLGLVYHKTGNLIGPIIIHAVNNTMLIAVMPYLA